MLQKYETGRDTERRLNGENFSMSKHKEQYWQLEKSGERFELFHVVAQVTKPKLCQRLDVTRIPGANPGVNVGIGSKDVLCRH